MKNEDGQRKNDKLNDEEILNRDIDFHEETDDMDDTDEIVSSVLSQISAEEDQPQDDIPLGEGVWEVMHKMSMKEEGDSSVTDCVDDNNESIEDELESADPDIEIKEGKKKDIKTLITDHKYFVIGAVFILILIVSITIFILIPNYHYKKGNELYNQAAYLDAAEQYKKAGSYKDAPDKMELSYRAQDYADGNALFSKGDYQNAALKYESAGPFLGASDKLILTRKIMHYQNGIESFDNGDYENAVKEFTEAKDYEDAGARLKKSNDALHYSKAEDYYSSEDYVNALSEYKLSNSYLDAEEKISSSHYGYAIQLMSSQQYLDAVNEFAESGRLDDSKDMILECGKGLLSEEDYVNSVAVFEMINDPQFVEYKNYASGMLSFQNSEFDQARSYFKLTEIENSSEMYKEATYQSALAQLELKGYSMAKSLLEEIPDYKDAQNYINISVFELAEESYSRGSLNAALEKYKTLPEDYERNGIAVKDRISKLNNNKKYVSMCGRWSITGGRIEAVENVYGYYQTGWGGDYKDLAEMSAELNKDLTVRCILNNDGTVRIIMDTYIAVFPYYTSVKSLMTLDKYDIKYNEVVSSFNGSIQYDSKTTISFSNNKYTISYKDTDSSISGLTDTLTTKVIYGDVSPI